MTIPLRRTDGLGIGTVAQVLVRHWLLLFNLSLGLVVLGAVAPPTLMALGLEGPGRILYTLYSFMCHQLPQRSYFLFGPQLVQTYSWERLIVAGMDPALPRQFLGTAQLGYKLGFAHRLTAMYSSMLVGGLVFTLLRRRAPRHISLLGYLLSWLPLVLDGGSHLVSEVTGLGFRAGNGWLQLLTGSALQLSFYTESGIGSFNWLMRTLTGALVGITTAWFVLPILQKGFEGQPAASETAVTEEAVANSVKATRSALRSRG